jgi:hypothetical protein
VVTAFRDLGADMQVGAARAGALTSQRVEGAALRFQRCRSLALGWRVRARVAAASGTAAAAYGALVDPFPDKLLRRLRRLFLGAVVRPRYRIAPEAFAVVYCMPWWAEPGSLVALSPWSFLLRALRLGHVTEGELLLLLAMDTRPVGLMAAARAGLHRCGVTVTPGGDRWTLLDGESLEQPLRAPQGLALRFLHAGWRLAQWAGMVRRRDDFPEALPACAAVAAAAARVAEPDRAGALRVTLTGGAVTQQLASRWMGDPSCPHCGAAVETKLHRYWECPRWASSRQGVVGFRVAAAAPAGLRETGLLARDTELFAARKVAEATLLAPLGLLPAAVAYTDGGAVDPADPLVRRAAWAVVWMEGARWCRRSGPCPGRQTVLRAELSAVAWAAGSAAAPLRLVSDCAAVVDGVAAVAAGRGDSLLDGQDGDLWRLVAAAPPTVHWVPAHLAYPAAAARGVAWGDWEGNRVADLVASDAARACRLPEPLLRRRREQLAQLEGVTQVIASVERDRLESLRQPCGGRRWRPRLPLMARPARLAPPPPLPEAPAWEGVHDLLPALGPFGPAGPGPDAAVGCRRCGALAAGRKALSRLLHRPCGAAGAVRFETGKHDLVAAGAGHRCARCGAFGRGPRGRELAEATCPVPRCFVAGQEAVAGAAAFRTVRDRLASLPGGGRAVAAAAAPPPQVRPVPLGGLRPFYSHWTLAPTAPARQWICGRCGMFARSRALLEGRPCDPAVLLPAAARHALMSGAYDAAVRDGPPPLRAAMAAMGWLPVHGLPE